MMPLNDDHLLAIGRIVVAFNSLEENAAAAVRILIGESTPIDVAQALTDGESFDRLVFKLKVLAPLRLPNPDLLADIDAWMREAKRVQEARNRVIHTGWIWWLDEAPDSQAATSYRRSARIVGGELREYTPSDLNGIAQSIREVNHQLRGLIRRMSSVRME
jgi:hypothetical protein